MDTAMIGALLKAYGAPNTPENINALTQRYASDPTAAERKINGLQGQSDESGGSRDAILNKMIDQAIAPAANVTIGEPVIESVQNSSVPTRRSATAGRQPINPQQYSNSPPSSGDPLANEVNQRTPANPRVDVPPSSGSGWEWLLPLLGIAAARTSPTANTTAAVKSALPTAFQGPEATFAGPMNKEVQPYPYTKTKTDRVSDSTGKTAIPEGQRAVNNDMGSNLLTETKKLDNRAPSTVTGSPENEALARKNQAQAELDAANKEANSIMKQMTNKKPWNPKLVKGITGRK